MQPRIARLSILALAYCSIASACSTNQAFRPDNPNKALHEVSSKDKASQGAAQAPPTGFGPTMNWDRRDDQAVFIAFINSSDPLGVTVSGLAKGDAVRVSSVSGICSFTNGDGKATSSIVAGIGGAATALAPEAVAAISAGQTFADTLIGLATGDKKRDAYGRDAGGQYQSKEGGVLICMPVAGGVIHRTTGLRKAPRVDAALPEPYVTIRDGFAIVRAWFPIPTPASPFTNQKYVTQSGELNLIAFDKADKFDDNEGYYKVILHIRKSPPCAQCTCKAYQPASIDEDRCVGWKRPTSPGVLCGHTFGEHPGSGL